MMTSIALLLLCPWSTAAEPPAPRSAPAQCHYTYTVWNAKARKSLSRRTVNKPYGRLTEAEKGPLGCTPCAEDQVDVQLSNGLEFKSCWAVAEKIRLVLEDSLREGQRIVSVVGYRPQMSRGSLDRQGNRTGLSNHSFGVALDLNEDYNGLYNDCLEWGRRCVLAKGGPYRPGHELSLTGDSPVVKRMGAAGFRWGGRLAGRQKDFMHFSPTGN
jgi:hypothetical protein